MSLIREDDNMPSSRTSRKWHSKPLMEKRRRARINQSLTELKNLITGFSKSKYHRSGKLEKADILELAVKFVQTVIRQKSQSSNHQLLMTKFREGFTTCAQQILTFLNQVHGVNDDIRSQLLTHLNTYFDDENNTNFIGKCPHVIKNPLTCPFNVPHSSKATVLSKQVLTNEVVLMICNNNRGCESVICDHALLQSKPNIDFCKAEGFVVISNPLINNHAASNPIWRPW